MPTNKDLKRLARTRMKKTGEAYTTARAHLTARRASPAPTPTKTDYAALAGMKDETVNAKTGCNWERWVAVLDKAGAADMPHKEIAAFVHDKYDVSGWWAQTITVGYERIRGLREITQRRSGTFDANKSKTVPVPVDKLYRALSVARTRNRWLPDVKLKVRKATPNKSLRITWDDGTSVNAYFTARSDTKSQVAIQHGGLASKSAVTRQKQFWTDRLADLTKILAPARVK